MSDQPKRDPAVFSEGLISEFEAAAKGDAEAGAAVLDEMLKRVAGILPGLDKGDAYRLVHDGLALDMGYAAGARNTFPSSDNPPFHDRPEIQAALRVFARRI